MKLKLNKYQQKRFENEVLALELEGKTREEAEQIVTEKTKKRLVKNAKQRETRHAFDEAIKSLGLTKVYGSVSRKVYWE